MRKVILCPSLAEVKTFRSLAGIFDQLKIGYELHAHDAFSRGLVCNENLNIHHNRKYFPIGNRACVGFVKAFDPSGFYPTTHLSNLYVRAKVGAHRMLNKDAQMMPYQSVPWDLREEWFLRPVVDEKRTRFKGGVYTKEKFKALTKNFPTTVVEVAPVLDIAAEYRHFVLDGEVIGCSQYSQNGQHFEKAVNAGVAYDFAVEIAKILGYGRYALDVGIVDGVPGVVEVNNFHTAGLYSIDLYGYAKKLREHLDWNE